MKPGSPADDAVGIWCWFCIVILANTDVTQPLVRDGRALVWQSHDIPIMATQAADEQVGEIVWACMRFLGILMLDSWTS